MGGTSGAVGHTDSKALCDEPTLGYGPARTHQSERYVGATHEGHACAPAT